MPNQNALSLDSYVIRRLQQFSLANMGYECLDGQGNKIFNIKRSRFGTEYSLLSDADAPVGIVHHNTLGLNQSFVLMDGARQELGTVVIKSGQIGGTDKSFVLQDASGNIMALVTGDYKGTNYMLTKADGTTEIARVNREMSGLSQGLIQMLTATAQGTFVITISDKDFPRLIVLEFVVAIDVLASTPSTGGRTGPFSGSPGAGGGVSIKM